MRNTSPESKPNGTAVGFAILLLCNMILLFGIYCYFVMRENINWIFWLYYGALAALAIGYVVYNRGFSRDKLTAADLPCDWSDEQKTAFLTERDDRKRRSKWMLTLLVPLCLTVLFDVIYLFFGDAIRQAFSTLFPAFFA